MCFNFIMYWPKAASIVRGRRLGWLSHTERPGVVPNEYGWARPIVHVYPCSGRAQWRASRAAGVGLPLPVGASGLHGRSREEEQNSKSADRIAAKARVARAARSTRFGKSGIFRFT